MPGGRRIISILLLALVSFPGFWGARFPNARLHFNINNLGMRRDISDRNLCTPSHLSDRKVICQTRPKDSASGRVPYQGQKKRKINEYPIKAACSSVAATLDLPGDQSTRYFWTVVPLLSLVVSVRHGPRACHIGSKKRRVEPKQASKSGMLISPREHGLAWRPINLLVLHACFTLHFFFVFR